MYEGVHLQNFNFEHLGREIQVNKSLERVEKCMETENDPESNGTANAYIRLSAETTDGV